MNPDDQHEIYEKARKYTNQKRWLYFHFMSMLIGSIILYIFYRLSKSTDSNYSFWFIVAIVFWLFLWLNHAVRIFIIKRFFGNEWERRETDKLLEKHGKKVEELENDLTKKGII